MFTQRKKPQTRRAIARRPRPCTGEAASGASRRQDERSEQQARWRVKRAAGEVASGRRERHAHPQSELLLQLPRCSHARHLVLDDACRQLPHPASARAHLALKDKRRPDAVHAVVTSTTAERRPTRRPTRRSATTPRRTRRSRSGSRRARTR